MSHRLAVINLRRIALLDDDRRLWPRRDLAHVGWLALFVFLQHALDRMDDDRRRAQFRFSAEQPTSSFMRASQHDGVKPFVILFSVISASRSRASLYS